MNAVFAARRPTCAEAGKSRTFSDRQYAILKVLAESRTSLSTRELRRRARMMTSEMRSACTWLKNRGLVDCQVKRMREPVFDGTALKLMAFWFVTEKGVAYLRQGAQGTSDK